MVAAAMGRTRIAAPRSGDCIQRVISGVSFTGDGVGHRADGGESAGSGGGGAGGDGFLVALAGLAQVNVNIDQTRSDDEAFRVDDVGAGGFDFAWSFDGGDFAVADEACRAGRRCSRRDR